MRSRQRILFITSVWPFPPTDGGKIATMNILQELAKDFEISFFSFEKPETPFPELKADIYTLKRKPWPVAIIESVASCKPASVMRYSSPKVFREVVSRIKEYELVFVDHIGVFHNLDRIPPAALAGIPLIIFEHNLEYRVWEHFGVSSGNPLKKLFGYWQSKLMERFENRAMQKANLIYMISQKEKEIVEKQLRIPEEKLSVLPITIPRKKNSQNEAALGERKENTILFTGSFSWYPNIVGLKWFLTNCWKYILEKKPSAKLILAGNDKNEDAAKLSRSFRNVVATGFVEDISDYFNGASVFVLPMQVGAGIKIKFLEALSYGLPVVTTSKGIEGIEGVVDGTHCIVEDNPQAFSEEVLHLLNNSELAAKLSTHALGFLENRWRMFSEEVDRIKIMARKSNWSEEYRNSYE
ncbi:glycosyltransferase family 4 protein [Mesotoga sp. H07.pep.5.3]|uniref:glycosyltransferase family 4 protein n=1 Tax=Mesotoga sp. H07.pep.5.3 TaxID=1421003 RepID=UPI000C19A733|nr:glycosyltransferase family 4 protein [Mesotoga sp. H07.pep.5.3]PIJ63026.1 hypothetical protein V513_02695 [Mesotoga sp. H07.pep.5.3]